MNDNIEENKVFYLYQDDQLKDRAKNELNPANKLSLKSFSDYKMFEWRFVTEDIEDHIMQSLLTENEDKKMRMVMGYDRNDMYRCIKDIYSEIEHETKQH